MAVSINGTSGVSGVDGSAGTPALQGSDTNTGISFGTDEVAINTGGTERAKVDSSGRLLVGTSSAFDTYNTGTNYLAGLEKSGTGSYAALALKTNSNDATGAYLALSKSRSTTANGKALVSNSDTLGEISFEGTDGTSILAGAFITAKVDGTPGLNDLPTRLTFSTTADGASSPTERMRIDSNGAVQIFDNLRPWTDNSVSNGTASRRWSVIYAGTGTINTSDANLKQDIANLEQAELNVAVAIKRLIKKFRFADAVADKGDDARIHVGVIAQEVKQAFIDEGLDPHRYGLFCEDTLEDGSKRLGIRYDELLAFVIAALLEGGAS